MKKQIYKNNSSISYKDEGAKKNKVIILIHGFIETSETWADFSKKLANNYRVISIDLPGHGESTLHNAPYTMYKYAESINTVIEKENIDKAFIIGHSMGGYVALAFAEKHPSILSGLCLFHSTPFADNEDKKNTRTETIKQIEKGRRDEICSDHSKSIYSSENIENFKIEISKGEQIAKKITKEGIIASILTMKNRNNKGNILKHLNVPFLYISGKKDKFIPISIINKIEMPLIYEINILENSGHMGFIEEKEKSLKYINDFYEKYLEV